MDSIDVDHNLPTAEAAPALTRFLPPELAVVVPTFNERDNLELLCENLSLTLAGISWELIVVDDNSPDDSAGLMRQLGRRYPNIRCIKRIGRRGLSSACSEGILSTNAPFVAVMDADHQHDEAILPAMLAKAKAGADIVIGSRFADNGSSGDGLSSARLKGSQLATKMSALVTGRTISDPMSGFFMLRRDLFETIAPKLSADGFKILLDIIVTAGRTGKPFEVAEVPYTFRSRHAGESKMNPLIVVQFLGLWLSSLTRGVLPTSFLLFSMVGVSGVAVHLATLYLFKFTMGESFLVAQIVATLVAMTWNFFINNVLTYSDKKLRGAKLWLGLLGFYAVCSIGGLANVSVASWIYEMRDATLLAGITGALMSSLFNYAVTRIFTWK
ncbi:glycosyltransferase family 2 protein [Devosia sp.]|uniref:glycosyltransferase family 2 protein n=1 Tax=Devosia sp. TaxID=1871048 RepID=UPI003262E4E5